MAAVFQHRKAGFWSNFCHDFHAWLWVQEMHSHASISSPEKFKLHLPLSLTRLWDSVVEAYMDVFIFTISSDSLLFTAWISIRKHLHGLYLSPLRYQTLWKIRLVVVVSSFMISLAVLSSTALGCPCAALTVSRAPFLPSNKKLLQTPMLCRNHPFVVKTPSVAVTKLGWRPSTFLSWNCAKGDTSCCPELRLQPHKTPLSWQLMRVIG